MARIARIYWLAPAKLMERHPTICPPHPPSPPMYVTGERTPRGYPVRGSDVMPVLYDLCKSQ